MADLSIVIVCYNSAETIADCIDAATVCSDDVIVVDNASTDGTAAIVASRPDVTLLANDRNLGFAGAVNQGVGLAKEPAVLVLNPDAVLLHSPQPLVSACLSRGYGAAAGRLTDREGRTQSGFSVRRLPTASALSFEALGINRLFPSNPVNRYWRALDLDLHREQDVEQPAGAFFMFRRELWTELGGFDEGFHPVWFEDVDFCRRIRNSNWKIRLVPEVCARHRGGDSIRKMDAGEREVQWYVSLLRYSAIAHSVLGRVAVATSVAVACLPRWVRAKLTKQDFEASTTYAKIFRASLNALSGRGVGVTERETESLDRDTIVPAQTSPEATKTHTHV